MSRKPKKRNKPYTGSDAAQPPVVRRYKAVNRSPLAEWWHEHKRLIKIVSIVTLIVVVVSYLIFELIRLVF